MSPSDPQQSFHVPFLGSLNVFDETFSVPFLTHRHCDASLSLWPSELAFAFFDRLLFGSSPSAPSFHAVCAFPRTLSPVLQTPCRTRLLFRRSLPPATFFF